MKNSSIKKEKQIGMPIGTATNRLRKSILFDLLRQTGKNKCFQCNQSIEDEKSLSIEHKIPYLDSENPVELFFDLKNIAFSHLKCNIGAARKTQISTHPSHSAYKQGCRCKECKDIEKLRRREQRQRNIKT